jgi:hypothetical protein
MAGYALAYPSNVWMVARSLKHGLMTERKPGTRFEAKDTPKPKPDAGQMDHSSMQMGEAAVPKTGSGDDGGGGRRHGAHRMKTDATRPQILAISGVSLVALAIGMTAPANWLNMSLSARDVGGVIMPRGMIMDRDTPAEAMRDMAAADPNKVTASYGVGERGDRELPYRLENGVKVFDLTTSVIRWSILPGMAVNAYAYNGQVPGPRIHIGQGDRVRIDVHNRLPEDTTVHWHGLIVPNEMDGPAEVTQSPIKPGGSYSYAFTADQHGTYFYHPHAQPDRTQALGLDLSRICGERFQVYAACVSN